MTKNEIITKLDDILAILNKNSKKNLVGNINLIESARRELLELRADIQQSDDEPVFNQLK